MKKYPGRFFSIFFSILSTVLFLGSCSDSEPRLVNVFPAVIFDFNSAEKPADVRMSIFAESSSDVHRVSTLRIVHNQSGLQWDISNPKKIIDNDKKNLSGYPNLLPVENSTIPIGEYTAFYTDENSNEASYNFRVNYPEEYLKLKEEDFPSAIQGSYSTKLALYDFDGTLIYFGDRKKTWKEDSMIQAEYSASAYYRIVYSLNQNNSVILMRKINFNR